MEAIGKLPRPTLNANITWNDAFPPILRQEKVLVAFCAVEAILIFLTVLYVRDATILEQVQPLRAGKTNAS